MSEGSGKPPDWPDAGDPARSVRDAAPSSWNRVSSVFRGSKGLSVDGSLDKTLRVVRSGTELDTVSVHV